MHCAKAAHCVFHSVNYLQERFSKVITLLSRLNAPRKSLRINQPFLTHTPHLAKPQDKQPKKTRHISNSPFEIYPMSQPPVLSCRTAPVVACLWGLTGGFEQKCQACILFRAAVSATPKPRLERDTKKTKSTMLGNSVLPSIEPTSSKA